MAGADHLIYDRDFSDAFLVSFLQTTSNGYINEYMQGFNALAQSFVSGVVGGMITSEIYGGEFAANFAHGFIGSYIDYTQNALEGILDTDFTLIEALELTMDFVPVVSNLKAAYEFSTGKTIFGGIELEPLDRNLAAASIFLGPVAKVAVTVARHSDEAADLLTASSKVHDATKATDAALNVTKGIENGAWRLAGANKATIDTRKLTEYALNPNHPVGGNKAKVFESALGFNQSNAGDLMKQLQKGVMNNTPVAGKVDKYGSRFTVDIPVTGPAGSGTVRTGWIFKPGSNTPEMTTLFVK
ncbi:DUF6883 domain-containing protein [Vibrio neptunius]|uniref:DUF6883 domain-containing protein n=1 Tax=Vibrio neptunius TaxID=170651 RepID=UPI0019D08316|nr:DUF6883 domain-containing protein [Vibrio neptunius]MBN3575893.1 pre-toxin TG domain-containing protein [Vibrio neptunius]